jgi:hypothetical protein
MKNSVALWIVVLTLVVLPIAAQETQPPPPAPTPAAAPAPEQATTPAAAPAAAAAAAPATAPATVPATAAASSSIPRVYYEKVDIVVDGKAEANGALKLEFLAQGGDLKEVTVSVLAKTKKKDIAKDIQKELLMVAGGSYKVKLSGDEVRISKTSKKLPNVSIVVTQLAVPGVSVRVEKG